MEKVLKNIPEEHCGSIQVPEGAKPWMAECSLNLSLCFTYLSVLTLIPVLCVPALPHQYLALYRWLCSEKVGIWLPEHLAEVGNEFHSSLRADPGCLSQEYKA